MFDQTGQQTFPESENGSLGLTWTRQERGEGKTPRAEGRPSFVSSAPPRSEGEALLHRIFSRGAAL